MAWKTIRDYVVDKGYEGDREKPIRIIVDAAGRGMIDEREWRQMYEARNKTSHTYDEEIADEVTEGIIEDYYVLLIQLETRLQVEKINTEKKG